MTRPAGSASWVACRHTSVASTWTTTALWSVAVPAKEVLKMDGIRWLTLLLLVVGLSGCSLTKVATVPMRVGGAVLSVVPGVGPPASEAIDKAAAAVDTLPF